MRGLNENQASRERCRAIVSKVFLMRERGVKGEISVMRVNADDLREIGLVRWGK